MVGSLMFLTVCALATAGPIVTTPLGQVEGVSTTHCNIFAGIPYSEPPLGDLRFRPAVPKKAWTGVRKATTYGAACLQDGRLQDYSMEDCLFVNVWTPSTAAKNASLPVMVYIHGGSFVHGAGSDYNASSLVQNGVVVVTINYRLGALGYLQSTELANDPAWPSLGGANGLNDQREALMWVKDNIRPFGGDPDTVTIFGESAGSLSVCNLMATSLTKGLFLRAIMQSGSCIGPWGPTPTNLALASGMIFVQDVGVTSVDALRKLNASVLLASKYFAMGPSIDGYFLKGPPADVFIAGDISLPAHGQVMLGSNTQDTLFAPPYYNGPYPSTSAAYTTHVTDFFKTDSAAVLKEYSASDANASWAYVKLNVDSCVMCPTKWLADILSSGPSQESTFVYQYAFYEQSFNGQHFFGAGHAAELAQVWNADIGAFPYNSYLAHAMGAYWTSFAKTGVPQGTVPWTPYGSPHNENYLVFDLPTITAHSDYNSARCDALRNLYDTVDGYAGVINFCLQQHILTE